MRKWGLAPRTRGACTHFRIRLRAYPDNGDRHVSTRASPHFCNWLLVPNTKTFVTAAGLVPCFALGNVGSHLPGYRYQKPVNICRRTLRHNFHVAIGQVAHLAGYREVGGKSLHGVAEPHTLDATGILHVLANHHGRFTTH
jgi:hypothetical protein